MTSPFPLPDRVRVAHLSPTRDNEFTLAPDADVRARIAAYLEIPKVKKFRFTGDIRPSGSEEWALRGHLEAEIVQECVVTLDPVATKIAEDVALIFSPHVSIPSEEEVEMGDDSIEPLGTSIHLGEIAVETLALALPLHPRVPGAKLPEAVTADPADDEEEAPKPFAGLADLLKKSD